MDWTAIGNLTGWGVVAVFVLYLLPKAFSTALDKWEQGAKGFLSMWNKTVDTFKEDAASVRLQYKDDLTTERTSCEARFERLMSEITTNRLEHEQVMQGLRGITEHIADVKSIVVRADKVIVAKSVNDKGSA